MTDLARLLAQLAALGHPVDLTAWEPNSREPRQLKMAVPLLGTNYRSPRPHDPERPSIATGSETSGHPDVSNHANDMITGKADEITAVTAAADVALTPEQRATATASTSPAAAPSQRRPPGRRCRRRRTTGDEGGVGVACGGRETSSIRAWLGAIIVEGAVCCVILVWSVDRGVRQSERVQ